MIIAQTCKVFVKYSIEQYWVIISLIGSRKRLENCKRRSSGSPRVPFSTSQLMTLEEEYTRRHYLSPTQVTDLANTLNLPQHRIKVWFQNRRAREKRGQEEDSSSKCATVDCRVSSTSGINLSLNCSALGKGCSQCERLYRCFNFNAFRYETLEH